MSTRTGEPGPKLFHILVTSDLSADSEIALVKAKEEVDARGREKCIVTLLTVVENPFAAVFDLDLGTERESVWIEAEAESRRQLEHLKDRYFHETLVHCITARQFESVGDEIGRFARSHLVDMLIIASHGRTGFSRTIFGSVAEKVVQTSHCPVLVVPVNRGQ